MIGSPMGKAMWLATSVLLAGCSPDLNGPLRPGEMAEASVNGVPLAIPMAFVPPHERFLYRRGTQEDGIRVEMNYPAMTPFVDARDDSPSRLRYQNQLAIYAESDSHPSSEARLELMRQLIEKAPRLERRGGRFEPWQWGLLRYESPEGVPELTEETFQGFDDDDHFIYPSIDRLATMIRCTSLVVPDAHSAEAQRRRERGEFTYVPGCAHEYRSIVLNDSIVNLSYQRGHLEHWREIQAAAEVFLARHRARERILRER